MSEVSDGPRTLAIDIGGSDLKLMRLGPDGQSDSPEIRQPVPESREPAEVLDALERAAESLRPFDRAAAGFPGPIVEGRILTAVNLGEGWVGLHLDAALERCLGVPVRCANDADVQGFGVIEGQGVELVLTLGTGIGTALFVDGTLVPNLELGHHPFRGPHSYEELLGLQALRDFGQESWNRTLRDAVSTLRKTFSFRCLYLGGGNARLVDAELLGDDVQVSSNRAGLIGGHALWTDAG